MLYSTSQVGIDAGLYFTLLFSTISISIFNIFKDYFYSSFCGFSESIYFDSFF